MENTRKIFITLHTGYCGMDGHEGWIVPASSTQEELDDLAWERAVEHAAMYGVYPPDDKEDGEEEPVYSGYNIDGSWKEYDEKKHSPYLCYGSNSKPQFQEY